MKFVHPLLSEPIEFKENLPHVLVIEERHTFSAIIQELLVQWQTDDGKFVFSENDTEYSMKKVVEVIANPFAIDINSKKILSGIIKMLEKISEWEEYFFKTKEILSQIDAYLEILVEESPHPIQIESMDVLTLIKGASVHIETEAQSLLEKVVDYMKAVRDFLHINHFIFVNLSVYLNEYEWNEFLKMINYEKYQVLFLEIICPQNSDNLQFTIIDADLCEINY